MKLKKLFLIMGAAVVILITSVPVYADSVAYTITVNKTETNQDTLSKRVIKGKNKERFCVTPDSFNIENASFYAYSKQKNGKAVSYETYVENGVDESRYGNYKKNYAPAGVYYFMQTRYGYSKTGTVKSTGTYQP